MSENNRIIDLSREQLKKIAGGAGSDSDTFSFACLECGTAFTVSLRANQATCPNCGAEHLFVVAE